MTGIGPEKAQVIAEETLFEPGQFQRGHTNEPVSLFIKCLQMFAIVYVIHSRGCEFEHQPGQNSFCKSFCDKRQSS